MSEQEHKPTEIAVKCLSCQLHFTIWTWHPNKHNSYTISCPECGQRDGNFCIWTRDLPDEIYTKVPGHCTLSELRGAKVSKA